MGTVQRWCHGLDLPNLRHALGFLGIILLTSMALGACGTTDEVEATTPETELPAADDGLVVGDEAPEIEFPDDPTGVIPPIDLPLIEPGEVTLVEFWNRSCVDCLAAREFLADLYAQYSPYGLHVLGIHSPDFTFEEDPVELERIVEQYRIPYQVIPDNEWIVWAAYENEIRPTRYLVGSDGLIAHRYLGSGGWMETEQAVRDTLVAAGIEAASLPQPIVSVSSPDEVAVTRNLYFGFRHNYHPAGVYAAQPEYYEAPEEPILLLDPGPPREVGLWYAHGEWSVDRDALIHSRESETPAAYVVFRFHAGRVMVLMGSITERPIQVVVQLDGLPLRRDTAGADVTWDEDGQSIVTVNETRIYEITELAESANYEIRLSTEDQDLALFEASFDPAEADR